jgi:hypothetical protein
MGILATISSVQSASYVWDNQEGLREVSNCKVVEMSSNPFLISKYTGRDNKAVETLRNSAKVGQSNLPIGSLIRYEEGGRNVSGYKYIYVIGVNKSAAPGYSRYLSRRNDKNYLFHRSILNIDDYAIELTEDVSPSWDESLKGMNLVPVLRPTYQKVECEDEVSMQGRDYLLFNGYRDGKSPIAIGVSIEETGIFKNIKTKKVSSLTGVQNVLAAELSHGELSDEVVETEEDIQEEVTEEITEEITEEGEEETEVTEITQEETVDPPASEQRVETAGIENVICHPTTDLVVRNEELDEVLFTAARHEPVKIFQSWEGEIIEKQKEGSSVVYIKVQFSDREENDQEIGWVSKKYVVEAANCPVLDQNIRDNPATKISGLDDEKCCDFPTVREPTHPYTGNGANQRRFRAGRKGGRLHAACDLYRYKGEGVRSVAPGKVIDRDHFYQGTSQITVKHDGGFVVRYGEIINNRKANMWVGKPSRMGEVIGYIGVVNSGCCRPMLHFELFRGNLRGPLTKVYRNMRGKFGRRDDLMNPTDYLVKWQNEVF